MTKLYFKKSSPTYPSVVVTPTSSLDKRTERTVEAFNPPIDWIRTKIEEAGNLIGSVHFYKREDNTLRKMSYRLHVRKPSVAKAPKVKDNTISTQVNSSVNRKTIDKKNNQMTVLDANKVVKDKEGKVIGRGAWRTVPLDKVVRISNKGTTYIIHRSY